MPRQSEYTQEVADAICERLSDGESLRAICRDEDMPAQSTVFKWLSERPAFSEQYARAREAQAVHMADEILSIADEECTMIKRSKHGGSEKEADDEDMVEVVFDPTAVARNRLRVDARKWLASKMAPKKYGDKLAIGGADDLPPIKTLSDDALSAKIAAKLAALNADDQG